MKDFREILMFITAAFIIPPIAISSGNIYGEVFGYAMIALVFLHVHMLDSQARLQRMFAANNAKLAQFKD